MKGRNEEINTFQARRQAKNKGWYAHVLQKTWFLQTLKSKAKQNPQQALFDRIPLSAQGTATTWIMISNIPAGAAVLHILCSQSSITCWRGELLQMQEENWKSGAWVHFLFLCIFSSQKRKPLIHHFDRSPQGIHLFYSEQDPMSSDPYLCSFSAQTLHFLGCYLGITIYY